jgi:virulence-associated protein VapD
MFAIAFDLLLHQTEASHPKSVSQAYADIGATLNRYGFTRVQGSVYLSQDENLVNVTRAMVASRRYPGFQSASATYAPSRSSIGATLRIS